MAKKTNPKLPEHAIFLSQGHASNFNMQIGGRRIDVDIIVPSPREDYVTIQEIDYLLELLPRLTLLNQERGLKLENLHLLRVEKKSGGRITGDSSDRSNMEFMYYLGHPREDFKSEYDYKTATRCKRKKVVYGTANIERNLGRPQELDKLFPITDYEYKFGDA